MPNRIPTVPPFVTGYPFCASRDGPRNSCLLRRWLLRWKSRPQEGLLKSKKIGGNGAFLETIEMPHNVLQNYCCLIISEIFIFYFYFISLVTPIISLVNILSYSQFSFSIRTAFAEIFFSWIFINNAKIPPCQEPP